MDETSKACFIFDMVFAQSNFATFRECRQQTFNLDFMASLAIRELQNMFHREPFFMSHSSQASHQVTDKTKARLQGEF